ncbi:MAG: hypothetical protein D6760_06935 [Deltaproteobacteria bacterium]|nr:MAG: hypothetical protein D6760_06935 [Deltaproteobacteria bacterium]
METTSANRRTLASSLLATGSSLVAAAVTVCAGCFAPVVFASMGGLGSVLSTWALVGARIEPYRPYLLAASVALLAASFWSLYAARRNAAAAACSIRTGRTARLSLLIATIVTVVAFAAPYLVFRYLVL